MGDAISVVPRPNETADSYVKRFTRKWRNSGLLDELLERKGYDKPSVKRRKKAARAAFRRDKK